MHTYVGGKSFIHYNSDFSGDLIIHGKDVEGNDVEVIIPAEDILKFVAYKYIAQNRISEIEDMEYKDLLK